MQNTLKIQYIDIQCIVKNLIYPILQITLAKRWELSCKRKRFSENTNLKQIPYYPYIFNNHVFPPLN
jgi:hypothetical protein